MAPHAATTAVGLMLFGAALARTATARAVPGVEVYIAPEWSRLGGRAHVVAEDLVLGELLRKGVRGWALEASSTAAPSSRLHLLHAASSAAVGQACNFEGGTGEDISDEAFSVCRHNSSSVILEASTELGLMMGAGRLLREISAAPHGSVVLPATLRLRVSPPPWAAMRGHQLTDWGFFFTDAAFEQYVKDLIVFGTNQIEFAHINYGRGDDDTLLRFSRIIDKYGLNLSLFMPPWPSNTSLRLFATMARIDSVLFEGGGGPIADVTRDDVSMVTAEPIMKQRGEIAAAVRKHHPAATVWMSPGGESKAWMDSWYAALRTDEVSSWLTGPSWGPVTLGSETQMLARIPDHYKIRLYPDICHTLTAQYPVPDWSFVWANTHGRQVVNPLPRHYSAVIAMNTNASLRARSVGFGGYSEGAADDFNKALWSALYMEPMTLRVEELVDQYSRHFFPPAGDAAGLLFGLEQNWVGVAATNTHVLSTIGIANQLWDGEPNILNSPNWRLQAHLMRAYFDGHVQARAVFEDSRELEAKQVIASAVGASGAQLEQAIARAQAVLARPFDNPVAQGWKNRTYALALAINSSSTLCGGCEWGGMAVLESQNPGLSLEGFSLLGQEIPGWFGSPSLSDTVFLQFSLRNLSTMKAEDQQAALRELIDWDDPGPMGYYDALGMLPRSPRLENGFGPSADPQYTFAPLIQFDEDYTRWPMTTERTPQRVRWHHYAQTYGDMPLRLRYSNLSTTAEYRVGIVYAYAGFGSRPPSNLTVIGRGGSALLHDLQPAPTPVRRQWFDIPTGLSAGGELLLQCNQQAGNPTGGPARGCQISEVWLSLKSSDEGPVKLKNI